MKSPYSIKEGYPKNSLRPISYLHSLVVKIVITFMLIFVTTDSGFNP